MARRITKSRKYSPSFNSSISEESLSVRCNNPFSDDWTLEYDLVGEALREIWDPALPDISDLLERGDRMTRCRAARILWNIDSAASRKILLDDLEHETDPAIKRLTAGKSVPSLNQKQ